MTLKCIGWNFMDTEELVSNGIKVEDIATCSI